MSASEMWRVRLDDGSEYGPVDEDKLLSWAREGRIAPSSQISSDGTTWILAPRKPELGMDWLVETSPGEYFGPFHHDVVQGLLDSKKITSETRTFRLVDKSEPALKSEIGKLRAALSKIELELTNSRENTTAERTRADRMAAELQPALAVARSELEAARVAAEKERAEQKKTKALLEKAEARETELEVLLKTSEEKCKVLAAKVESEQDRGRKLGEMLSASACREASLAEEARSIKNAMDQTSARVRELSEELESARAEVVKERQACGELRAALEKAEKAGKKTGFGSLFQGKSLRDLSLLELAAQREFARRKRGRGPSGHDRPNADVIDV